MKIASFDHYVIGESQVFPIPPLHSHGRTSVPLHAVSSHLPTLCIINAGHEAIYIKTGPTAAAAEVSADTGVFCGAGATIIIARNAGDLWFGAVSASAMPSLVAVGLGG